MYATCMTPYVYMIYYVWAWHGIYIKPYVLTYYINVHVTCMYTYIYIYTYHTCVYQLCVHTLFRSKYEHTCENMLQNLNMQTGMHTFLEPGMKRQSGN